MNSEKKDTGEFFPPSLNTMNRASPNQFFGLMFIYYIKQNFETSKIRNCADKLQLCTQGEDMWLHLMRSQG